MQVYMHTIKYYILLVTFTLYHGVDFFFMWMGFFYIVFKDSNMYKIAKGYVMSIFSLIFACVFYLL